MEQHLGHGTFYQNLRAALGAHPALEAAWIEVSYFDAQKNAERILHILEEVVVQ